MTDRKLHESVSNSNYNSSNTRYRGILVYAEFSDAAVRFAEYLTNDRLRLLSDFPKIFPLVEGCTGVRKIADSPFLIFYRIHEQEKVIRVLRYWHGAKEGKPFLG